MTNDTNDQLTSRMLLTKSKWGAASDLAGLLFLAGVTYYILNPGAFDKITDKISDEFKAAMHRLSVWQTKISIRSLPETDENTE